MHGIAIKTWEKKNGQQSSPRTQKDPTRTLQQLDPQPHTVRMGSWGRFYVDFWWEYPLVNQHNYWKLMNIAHLVPMTYLVKRVIFQFAMLVYVSLPECIWRFPKMGAPPNHPRPMVTWGSTKCDNDIV